MKTVEELLQEWGLRGTHFEMAESEIKEAFKEYASLACAEQRKLCAEQVFSEVDYDTGFVVEKTIINTPNPELL